MRILVTPLTSLDFTDLSDDEKQVLLNTLVLSAKKLAAVWQHKARYAALEDQLVEQALKEAAVVDKNLYREHAQDLFIELRRVPRPVARRSLVSRRACAVKRKARQDRISCGSRLSAEARRAQSRPSTSSSVASRRSALARENGSGGRILRTLSNWPMRPMSTPRSFMRLMAR